MPIVYQVNTLQADRLKEKNPVDLLPLGVELGQRGEDKLTANGRPPRRISEQLWTGSMIVIQDRAVEHGRVGIVLGPTDDHPEGAVLATTRAAVAVEHAGRQVTRAAASDRFAEMQDVGDCGSQVSFAEGVETVSDFGSRGRYNLGTPSDQLSKDFLHVRARGRVP